MGAQLLNKQLPNYLAGKITLRPQLDDQATFTKMLTKADGQINWEQTAEQIYNQFRAFVSWPGIWTTWQSQIVKILECSPESTAYSLPFGTVARPDDQLIITCSRSNLIVSKLQLAGGRPLSAEQFLLGHPDFIGKRLPSRL